jgi:hypothetical protein
MKATINEVSALAHPLWQGEMISATWDCDRGEFIIRGDADNQAYTDMMRCVKDKIRMAIDIEDSESAQLIWQGHVGNADFLAFGSDEMECCLTISVEDWWGILPRLSGFYFS